MTAFRRLLLLSVFAAGGVALALGVVLSCSPSEPSEAEAEMAAAAAEESAATQASPAGPTRPGSESSPPSSGPSSVSSPAGVDATTTTATTTGAKEQKPRDGAGAKSAPQSAAESARQSPAKTPQACQSGVASPPEPNPGASVPRQAAATPGPLAESYASDGQLADPYPRLARLVQSAASGQSAGQDDAATPASPSSANAPRAGKVGQPTAEAVPAPEGIRLPTGGSPSVPGVTQPARTPAGRPARLPQPAASDSASGGDAVRASNPPALGFPGNSETAANGQAKPPVAKITSGEGDEHLSIHIQNADIREVLELLSEKGNLNILAGNAVQGKVSATLRGVDIDSALKAILKSTGLVSRREGKFIYVGTPQEFEQIEQSLDKVGARVYRPNYVTAEELKSLIQPLLTASTGTAAVSPPPEKGISSTTEANGNSLAVGDALVVRDYEAVLAQVDQVVAEIDVRPLQVAIEAMILSVKLNDGNDFGVNFELLQQNHMKFGWGTIPNQSAPVKMSDKITVPASSTALDGLTSVLLNGGLKFGYLDQNVGVFLNALEKIGDTNVIATPRVTVLNKQRAYVHIGEKLGYISTTVTETASTSSVEFLDVGTELRLRPFVSRDGIIRMEVHPELSTGTVEKELNYTIPNKAVTEVTTNVMVRDGCTAVIGGLMRNELKTTTTQVPVLGNLPWVGLLFRGSSETMERHEVIVLITPRIIYDPEMCQEGDKDACEYHRRQAVYAEKMSPFSKRWIARRYFRLAQSAWAEGDRDRALRFAELSVHFDPLSRAAIDLRSDIWQGKAVGDHTSACPAGNAGAASAIDGQAVAPWLLKDLEHGAAPSPVLPHPMDPGQPGGRADIKRPRVLQQ